MQTAFIVTNGHILFHYMRYQLMPIYHLINQFEYIAYEPQVISE